MWPTEKKLKDIKIEGPQDIRGMRRALLEAERWNWMTRSVSEVAYVKGLSGEDKYTLLAYHAVLQNEDLLDTILDARMRAPTPVIFAATADGAPLLKYREMEEAALSVWRLLNPLVLDRRRAPGSAACQSLHILERVLSEAGRLKQRPSGQYEEVEPT